MTDSPRFKPFTDNPDEAHLQYHGGRLVDALLGWADRRRDRALPVAPRPEGRRLRPIVRRLQASVPIALLAVLLLVLFEATIGRGAPVSGLGVETGALNWVLTSP